MTSDPARDDQATRDSAGHAPRERLALSAASLFSLLGVLVFLAGAGWALSRTPEELAGVADSESARDTITARLKQLGAALDAYHQEFAAYPPAFVAGEDGAPRHSWRVLLLPYLGEEQLYKQYSFAEPWDGPNNSRLADRMPDVFASPLVSADLRDRQTAYQAVVGEGTAWRGDAPVTRAEITDRADRTILLVEHSRRPVHWLAPEDLQFARMGLSLRAEKDQALFAEESDQAHVLMVDHTVDALTGRLPKARLRELLEISDGKPDAETETGESADAEPNSEPPAADAPPAAP